MLEGDTSTWRSRDGEASSGLDVLDGTLSMITSDDSLGKLTPARGKRSPNAKNRKAL